MKNNRVETDTKKSGGSTNTVGVGTVGVQTNTANLTESEVAKRGSERGSEVIVDAGLC